MGEKKEARMGLAKGRIELHFAFRQPHFTSPISTNEIRPYFAKVGKSKMGLAKGGIGLYSTFCQPHSAIQLTDVFTRGVVIKTSRVPSPVVSPSAVVVDLWLFVEPVIPIPPTREVALNGVLCGNAAQQATHGTGGGGGGDLY